MDKKFIFLLLFFSLLLHCIQRENLSQNTNQDNGLFRILFFASEDTTNTIMGKTCLYSINSDGSEINKLKVFNRHVTGTMEVSPDGSKVLIYPFYISNTDGTSFRSFLHTEFSTGKWSPIKKDYIIYVTNIEGNNEIFSMDIWESDVKQLTINTVDDIDPVWSVDGNKILFTKGTYQDFKIWQMDSDGSNQQLFIDTTFSTSQPRFNYDYTLISCIGEESNYPKSVYVGDIDDLVLEPLNFLGDYEWDPVANRITYISVDRKYIFLYDHKLKSHKIIKSSLSNSLYYNPQWSSDGKSIIVRFQSFSNMDSGIEIIDVASEKSQIIVDYNDFVGIFDFVCLPINIVN